MLKRVIPIMMVAVLLILSVTGCGTQTVPKNEPNNKAETSNEEKIRVALITDNQVGVNPFFTQMEIGMERAINELGIEGAFIESTDINALEENIRASVADGYDLIIATSAASEDPLSRIAKNSSGIAFAIIDVSSEIENVRSVFFKEQEGAFLVGAIAGLVTETQKVGHVSSMQTPGTYKYRWGFEQGVKKVNPNASVSFSYVGSYSDPAKAKELANLLNSQGADFINAQCAVGNLGVIEAAGEKGFFTSGQDVDMTGNDVEHVITSQLKATDVVVYETIKDFVEGNWDNEKHVYGVKEGAIGVVHITKEGENPMHDVLTPEIINTVKDLYQQISNGDIVLEVPEEK